MTIIPAIPSDAATLTELTMRSKAYWGYSNEHMHEWQDELTITGSYIEKNHVWKLKFNDKLMGFYACRPNNNKDVKLDFLFVDPAGIGHGYGKALIIHCLQLMESKGFKRVIVDADPHAEPFYKKAGFKVVSQLKSSIKDRFLPVMERLI